VLKDVFINSVYDPAKYEFSTRAQYQVQPETIMQSQINRNYKIKSERSVNKNQKSLSKSDRSDHSINNSISIKNKDV
jgi:hypothetical protein